MGGILKGVGNFLWGEQPEPDFSLENMKRPERITYKGLTDAQGNLANKYKLSNGADYKAIANQGLQQKIAKASEDVAKQQAGAQIEALNRLATKTGVSGGVAASVARQGATDKLNALQGLTQKGIEEGQKISEKTFDIGREAEKINLANLIGDVRGQQAFTENMYGLDMNEFGASKTSDSMKRNAPRPKGGVLGGITQGVGSVIGKA